MDPFVGASKGTKRHFTPLLLWIGGPQKTPTYSITYTYVRLSTFHDNSNNDVVLTPSQDPCRTTRTAITVTYISGESSRPEGRP